MIWPFTRKTHTKTNLARKAIRRARPYRTILNLERLEDRELLSGTGFIQGTASVTGGLPLPGATIALYSSNGATLLGTDITDAHGNYSFGNLAAGVYRVVETPPAGYANLGVQILSSIDPAQQINQNTIQVTVVAPSPANPLNLTIGNTTFPDDRITGTIDGTPFTFGGVQFYVAATGGGLTTQTPEFFAFCVDLFHDIGVGSSYPVTTASSGASLTNGGEIGYLVNHFNTSFGNPLSELDAAGLQLAIWEAEYGSRFVFKSSADSVTGQDATAAVAAAAQAYLNAAAGKSENALFLDETLGGTVGGAGQGLITNGSFNFRNDPVPAPQISVVKTADAPTITAGQTAGYTVTITNNGNVKDYGVALSDPLPAGAGSDISWVIDTSGAGHGAGTNPADFQITGSAGNQSLSLSSSFINGMGDSLAPGQSISVHITGVTSANDLGGSASTALGAAGNYAVLYDGIGGHNLQITNVTINGNVGVGGTGNVHFSGPGAIKGRLDFSAANTGQYSNNNNSNVGPTAVNFSASAVTTALNTVHSLNSALAGLGNSLVINGTQTISESAGQLDTVNGVAYRVFNVTSYSENDGKLLTIVGDGSGDPVVFNFGRNNNVNLGGDVALTGGLTPDQVLWNFMSQNQNIQLNNNASSYRTLAFQGTILAPNDAISIVNSNLIGRVFGGDSHDMQIVSGDTITAPTSPGKLVNTATVSATGASSAQFVSTITVDPLTL